MTPVSHRQIIKHFGGYIAALRDTGLEFEVDDRARSWRALGKTTLLTGRVSFRNLRNSPSMNEYNLLSQYSPLSAHAPVWRLAACAAWLEAVC